MDSKTTSKLIRVAFLIPDQFWSGSISLVTDMLVGTNHFSEQEGGASSGIYEISLLNHPDMRAHGMGGQKISSLDLDDTSYNIVAIPAIWSISPKSLKKYPMFYPWLRRQNELKAHFVSLTNSAFFLAEAGLLDEQEISMHWAFRDLFHSLYPKVKVRSDLESCYTGRFWSSSGIAPTVDLIYQLIRHFSGEHLAQKTQKYFLPEHKVQDTASIDVSGGDSLVRAIRDWVHNHHTQSLSGQEIAEHFNMSYRNLNRRFSKQVGMPVYEYLQTVRLDKSAKLLSSTSLSVEQIAIQCGYSSQNVLTRNFKKKFGKSPMAYRQFMRTES